MKTRIILAVVAGFALLSGCSTPTRVPNESVEHCASISAGEVAGLFDRWNESLRTGDADRVVANYSDDAVLLPTVSNKPRTTHAEIKDYFVHFLENHPQGRIDRRFVKIGCNEVRDAGLYTFTLSGDRIVQARYTFIYQYTNGQWLISHHHSSAMPEK